MKSYEHVQFLDSLNDSQLYASHWSNSSIDFHADTMLQRCEQDFALLGHEGCVNTLSMDYSNQILLSGSDDCTLKLWTPFTPLDSSNSRPTQSRHLMTSYLPGHQSNILSAHFLRNTRDTIVSGGADGLVILTKSELNLHQPFHCHKLIVHQVLPDPLSPHTFFTCGKDKMTMVDLRVAESCKCDGCDRFALFGVKEGGNGMRGGSCFDLDGVKVLVGGVDDVVREFDRRFPATPTSSTTKLHSNMTGTARGVFSPHPTLVYSFCSSQVREKCAQKMNAFKLVEAGRFLRPIFANGITCVKYDPTETDSFIVSFSGGAIYRVNPSVKRPILPDELEFGEPIRRSHRRHRRPSPSSQRTRNNDASPLSPTLYSFSAPSPSLQSATVCSSNARNGAHSSSSVNSAATVSYSESANASTFSKNKRRLLADSDLEEEKDRLTFPTYLLPFFNSNHLERYDEDAAATFRRHRNSKTFNKQAIVTGSCLLTGSDNGLVYVYNKYNGKLLHRFQGDSEIVNCVVDGGGGCVICSGIDDSIKISFPSNRTTTNRDSDSAISHSTNLSSNTSSNSSDDDSDLWVYYQQTHDDRTNDHDDSI